MSACPNAIVLPSGTSSPAPRNRRANPTANRSSSTTSGTALDRRVDELTETVRAGAFLVFAVLQDRAERDVDRTLVDRQGAERGERIRPVDRLGDARRLVELELAEGLHRGRDLAGQHLGDLGCPHSEDGELAVEVGV